MKVTTAISAAVLFFLVMAASSPAVFGKERRAGSSKTVALAGPETTLNAAAHYLESIFENRLASLELIALTPEARSGDWKGLRQYLERLESRTPGTYFYVLPDGNYYSLALDYTGLNLFDRPYFESLFAGNPVRGYPIHSRSSGRKSALMAAPILDEGQATGALGASIYLDDLHQSLNRAFALPENYTWFVLDSEGNTMLDRDRDFIFMNAITQGSPSLRDAVTEALQHESGAVSYELGGIRHAHYRKLSRMDWWMFLAQIQPMDSPPSEQQTLSLDRFVPALQRRLNEIDGALAASIEKHPVSVESEGSVRSLLAAIIDENPEAITVAFIDSRGVLRQNAPADYRNFENVDISDQTHVKTMLNNPMPMLGGAFTAIEGFPAVSLARPLYDEKKAFVGYISVLVRPELLFESLLRKSTIPEDYELWVMQTDGLILYDQDEEERGRMLFSDPLYADFESLLALGREIVARPSGKGNYIFAAPITEEKVIKTALWQTVSLHDRQWRVVLAYRPYE